MSIYAEPSLVATSRTPLGRRDDVTRTRGRVSTGPTPHHSLTSHSMLQEAVATPTNEPDPYLLILLADQEVQANRPEEVQSLIEAAYAAYDQCSLEGS
jgi:hypothetical protein